MEQTNQPKNTPESEGIKDPRLILWMVVAIFFLGVIFYFGGFRLERGFGVSSPGSIELKGAPEESLIIIDGAERAKVKKGRDGAVVRFVSSGAHTVSVFKEGFWPWQKPVNVENAKKTELFPFLVSKNPSGSIVAGTDPEYEKIVSLIKEKSALQSVTSKDGRVTLLKEDGILRARFNGNLSEAPAPFCEAGDCLSEVIIFSTESAVRGIDFYKGRSDVALVALSNGIFALEIDNINFQNFQPIYKGKEPIFAISDSGTLLLSDAGAIIEINW